MQPGIVKSNYRYKKIEWSPKDNHAIVVGKEQQGDPRPLLLQQNKKNDPSSLLIGINAGNFDFIARNTTTGAITITQRGTAAVRLKPNNEDLTDSTLIRRLSTAEEEKRGLTPEKLLEQTVAKTEQATKTHKVQGGAAAVHTLLYMNADGEAQATTAVLGDCRAFAVKVDLTKLDPEESVTVTSLTPELHGLGHNPYKPFENLSADEIERLLESGDIAFTWFNDTWYICGESFQIPVDPSHTVTDQDKSGTPLATLLDLAPPPPQQALAPNAAYFVWYHNGAWHSKIAEAVPGSLNMTHAYADHQLKPRVSAKPAIHTTPLGKISFVADKLQFIWESTDGIDLTKAEIATTTQTVLRVHGARYKELFAQDLNAADDFILEQIAVALDALALQKTTQKEVATGKLGNEYTNKDNRTGQITSFRRIQEDAYTLNSTIDAHSGYKVAQFVCAKAPTFFEKAIDPTLKFRREMQAGEDKTPNTRNYTITERRYYSATSFRHSFYDYAVIINEDPAQRQTQSNQRLQEQQHIHDHQRAQEEKSSAAVITPSPIAAVADPDYAQANSTTESGVANIRSAADSLNLTYIKTGKILNGALLEDEQWQEVFTGTKNQLSPISTATEQKAAQTSAVDFGLAIVQGSNIYVESNNNNYFYAVIQRANGDVECHHVTASEELKLSDQDQAFLVATDREYPQGEAALQQTAINYFQDSNKRAVNDQMQFALHLANSTKNAQGRPAVKVAVTSVNPNNLFDTKYLMMATGENPDNMQTAHNCYSTIDKTLDDAVYPRACLACEQEILRLKQKESRQVYQDRGETLLQLWSKGSELRQKNLELAQPTRRATMELAAQTKILATDLTKMATFSKQQEQAKQAHDKKISRYTYDHLSDRRKDPAIAVIMVILDVLFFPAWYHQWKHYQRTGKFGKFYHETKRRELIRTAKENEFYNVVQPDVHNEAKDAPTPAPVAEAEVPDTTRTSNPATPR